MRIQPTRSYTAEPGSVAMTDMVLNLFIFFFISFSLLYTFSPNRLARVPVNPPVSANPTAKSLERSIVVTIDHTGLLYVGETPVTFRTLKTTLMDRVQNGNETTVLVRADRLVTVQDVVRVMETAQEVGASDVSITVVKWAQPLTGGDQ